MERRTYGEVKSREQKSRRGKEKESEERRYRCANVRQVAKHCVFPMICGSRGSKSRLAKAAGAEPCGETRNEKVHGVVARSTFPSQNVQNTPGLHHFWKFGCRKVARCCGTKHIFIQVKTSVSGHFWKFRCQKWHAAVARSKFPSQNVKNMRGSGHFWRDRC